MIDKKLYIVRFYLLFCLAIYSSFSFGQDCDQISLDSITNPGPYDVATLTESDDLRNGPGYAGATIYYPTNATPPFASIAIVPGFVSAESTIGAWGPFLASHGIVTMTIGTNSLLDDPSIRGEALLDAIITIKEENTRMGSPLLGNLDTESFAVGGWSMGGGGAQLAGAADPSLKAVVALCPWLNTNLIPQDLDHSVPLLIFSGEVDGTAPPASHADVHYDFTPETTNKLIYEIENEGHRIANDPLGGGENVGKIALSWLKHYLIGDSCYCPLFLDAPNNASNYMTNVVCPDITTYIDDQNKANNGLYKLYPNPSSGSINLKVENMNQQIRYEIISSTGTKILDGSVLNKMTNIDIQSLPSGAYIMNLIRFEASEKIRFIVM